MTPYKLEFKNPACFELGDVWYNRWVITTSWISCPSRQLPLKYSSITSNVLFDPRSGGSNAPDIDGWPIFTISFYLFRFNRFSAKLICNLCYKSFQDYSRWTLSFCITHPQVIKLIQMKCYFPFRRVQDYLNKNDGTPSWFDKNYSEIIKHFRKFKYPLGSGVLNIYVGHHESRGFVEVIYISFRPVLLSRLMDYKLKWNNSGISLFFLDLEHFHAYA